jgi:hypothetical protein
VVFLSRRSVVFKEEIRLISLEWKIGGAAGKGVKVESAGDLKKNGTRNKRRKHCSLGAFQTPEEV